MIYCDTSTIAKLYVPEAESPAVRRRLESEDMVFASELARVELMGVFHRRLREKRWTRADFQIAVRQFTTDDISDFFTWLPLDNASTEAAAKTYATLPDTIFLRSADCLHLVTALRHGIGEVLTHDGHQTAAAATLGIKATAIA
jgi:predicted nucleic acid-binding protein